MQHIKKLDSIRAIAAILVILWHWVPADSFINTFDNGAIGVNIFFVLSGFLITRILFTNRNEAEISNDGKANVFKNFYARRSLRIFPIYYLLVLLIFFFHKYLGAQFSKGEFISSITYTINFYFFKLNHWADLTVHFWSLAVEEQFYLLWPFVILFVNRKYLVPAILSFITIGVASQCFIKYSEFRHILTFTCFDSFGFGALLAWIVMYRPQLSGKFYNVLCILAPICILVLITQIYFGIWAYLPQRTIHSLIALWMITYVVLNKGRSRFSFSSILNNKVLFFLGKISYGIYLYHVPVQWFGFILSPLINRLLPFSFVRQYNSYFVLIINFCLLIFISWLSWLIIERPILSLKKYFNYQNKQHSAKKQENIIALDSA